MKKLLTVAVAGLLIAACTSGDPDDASSDTTAGTEPVSTEAPSTEAPSTEPDSTEAPSTEPESTEPESSEAPAEDEFVDQSLAGASQGITDDTIKLGITYIDLQSVEGMSIDHGDYGANFTALIDDINANGGINGRMIEPVIAPISIADGGNADAVCVQLTEDEQVFAVLGFFLGDAPACYLELHETAIVGGTQTEDLLSRAAAPWYTREPGSDFEGDAIREFADAGLLDGTVGVMAVSTDQALVEGTILPILEEVGVDVAEVGLNDAPADDIVAGEAQSAAILQRMEAAGVDTIIAPANNGAGLARALEETSYRPTVLITNANSIRAQNTEGGHDLSVLEGAVAAGTYGPIEAQVTDADFLKCREVSEAAGIEWVEPSSTAVGSRPWISLLSACMDIELFKAIATFAGPNLNYGTYEEAGNTIGEVKLPGTPEPYFFGAPPHADGDTPVFLYAWDPAAEDFVLR